MLLYLLKRLLLALPALWLLATLVFLLSRLLPGSFGASRFLEESAGYYSKGSASSRQSAYLEYLRRTGQDLPLFYFSLTASPEPDTLSLIYPETERLRLKRLVWRYGNWPAVAAYHRSIKALEEALAEAEEINYLPQLGQLHAATEPASIKSAVEALTSSATAGSTKAAARQLEEAAARLVREERAYAYLLPDFRWHGAANQYHQWLTQVLRGDLGTSYRSSRPVQEVLREAVGNTWWLVFASIILAFAAALELSIRMVRRQNLRRLLMPWLYLVDSLPLFVLALLLLVLLANPAFLQLFPVYGMGYYTSGGGTWLERAVQQLPFMALPILCLTIANIPYLTNQSYQALADAAGADYARTAKAKGLSGQRVIRRHVLRNALLPIITLLSDALPALVAGAVVIETVFAIPGMGRLFVESVLARDYPVILGIVLVVAVFKVASHLLADLGYALADPRIRFAAS